MENRHFIYDDLLEDPHLLGYLKAKGKKTVYPSGKNFLRQGESSPSFYLLDGGVVEMSAVNAEGNKKIFAIYTGRALLGTLCADGQKSPISYRCLQSAELYCLRFDQLPLLDADVLIALIKYVTAETLILQNQLRLSSASDSVDGVKKILEEYHRVMSESECINAFLTQQMIGEMLGKTPTQIKNVLKKIGQSNLREG